MYLLRVSLMRSRTLLAASRTKVFAVSGQVQPAWRAARGVRARKWVAPHASCQAQKHGCCYTSQNPSNTCLVSPGYALYLPVLMYCQPHTVTSEIGFRPERTTTIPHSHAKKLGNELSCPWASSVLQASVTPYLLAYIIVITPSVV